MPNRRKPTALKLLQGNPGKRPLNDAEPQPKGEVRPPESLGDAALEVWDEFAPDLIAQGVLRSWDTEMFAAWCELAAMRRSEPRLVVLNSSVLAQMRMLAGEFGMTPASRSKIKAGAPEKTDAAAEILSRRSGA